jgi:hypothetical protein
VPENRSGHPGVTLDETVLNLREAVALHLEGENLTEFGLAPTVLIKH